MVNNPQQQAQIETHPGSPDRIEKVQEASGEEREKDRILSKTEEDLDNLRKESLSEERLNQHLEEAVKLNTVEIRDRANLEESDEIDISLLSERDRERVEEEIGDERKLKIFELVIFLIVETLSRKEGEEFLNEHELNPEDNTEHDLDDIPETFSRPQQEDSPEIREGHDPREKIVEKASKFIGSEAFRGPEVGGGRLACAQVVSRILREAGVLGEEYLGVAKTVEELRALKWVEHTGPPRPGDIIVWNRTTRATSDGNVIMGHAHIGIALTSTHAISNSSSRRSPRMHPIGLDERDGYWHRRGVAKILSPPAKTDYIA